ncbi:hypothetical protein GCK72_021509 [Caenorhabditis remanei]|uniref:GATA-type domain-containing protein n=1 Tax=Caenorhabditis remanei TaxID=31234 RepID=A0A6A5GJP0_CAERE|nr:hypothetical protein GCK72_021509 [Caenorhabditis remanei]KAF1754944.1 hypothetical protein GCK72_021509 [Caenorhabditis remanei]
MDPLSYPLPTFNVDSSNYSGYYPNTDYWNWVNYYYQNGFTYDHPTSSGYSFMTAPSTFMMSTPSTSVGSDSTLLSMTPPMPTSTFATPSTSSASSSTATPSSMLSMTPSFYSMSTGTSSTTPHRPQGSHKQCSHCFATDTCQWRNVRSENGVLCNACFIYQRKYKKTRPVTAMEKYKSKKAHRQSNSD